MDSKRFMFASLLSLLTLMLAWSFRASALPIADTDLSIAGYTLVNSQRISRFEFDYTYTAQVTNSGADVLNLTATLSSNSPAMTVIDASLNFGDVASGLTLASSDSFVVRHDRRLGAFDTSAFVWDVQFDSVNNAVPSSAQLNLSNDAVPTSGAGGSVDAQCSVLNAAGQAINPPPPVTLSTDSASATLSGTVFSFPDSGSYTIQCAVDGTAIVATQPVVVLSDVMDPAYSTYNADLSALDTLHDDVVLADEADDLSALQTAKNALQARLTTVDIAALASAPPLPADADLPSPGELLAAGDTPNPAIDDAFKATILSIEQNLIQANTLLNAYDATTVNQADIDALDSLTQTLDSLADALLASADPSHTAILDVNDELNNIVSNLLPAQSVRGAQFTIDSIALVSGITANQWRHDSRLPEQVYAQLMFDARTPAEFYAHSEQASLLPLPGVGLLWKFRMKVFKKLYLPLLKQIARNLRFLDDNNFLPTGLAPPVIDIVAGPSLGNVLPGTTLSIWGSGFPLTVGDNQVQLETARGVFNIPVLSVDVDGSLGEYLLRAGPVPGGLCTCFLGIPEQGRVTVTTPGGSSAGYLVNVFP